jgi:hypothetical protein
MMAEESSSDRSENSIVICGADIRMITKAKNPMSVTATATMAAIRAAPSDFKNSTSPFTDPDPGNDLPGKNCPVHGYRRVNEWPGGQEMRGKAERCGYSITSTTFLSWGSTIRIWLWVT